MTRAPTGPGAYHKWWRMTTKLSPPAGVAEHGQCCRPMQLVCVYDQLDMASLANAKAIDRRLQLMDIIIAGGLVVVLAVGLLVAIPRHI